MTSRYQFARLGIVLAFSLVLTACGNAGPSKSGAAKAISEYLLPDVLVITVQDLKCNKTGNDTFDCQVLYTVDRPDSVGTNHPAVMEFEFIKLGGKWLAKAAGY